MRNIKVLVYSKSYLIRNSISRIIYEKFSNVEIKETDATKEVLEDLIISFIPHVVIVDISCKEDVLKNISLHSPFFIGVIFSENIENKCKEVFDEVITIFDSRKEITLKIENVFKKELEGTEEHIQDKELSEREKEILKYVAMGYTNKEIADKLFLSVFTVMTHRKNITAKLGIKTISGLTLYAILTGIVSLSDVELK